MTPIDTPDHDPVAESRKRRRMRFSRSRFGCDSCRHHKKKCDETRPVCGRCNALRKVCAYTYPQAGRSASARPEEDLDIVVDTGPPTTSGSSPPSILSASVDLPSLSPVVPVTSASGLLVDDSFLRAFSFSSDVVVPPWTPPDASAANADFDSFWAALGGTNAENGEQRTPDETLMEYYRLVVSHTILGLDEGPSGASQFYKGVVSQATQQDQGAMMHAVLAVSAQHLSNFARAFNSLDKAVSFNEQAAHHRSEALYLLRVSSKSSETNLALLPSVTLLLTLSSVLKGDADIIPSFLDQTKAYLDNITHPSTAPHLPTVSAIYSIYRVLQAVSSSQQLDLSSVFQYHDPQELWISAADETVERLVGISRDMLVLFSRVNSLVLEWNALHDGSRTEDLELHFLQMEVRSQCSMIQHDLEDESIWSGRWSARDPRLAAGLEFYRAALRIMILRDVLGLPANHPRVEPCVDSLISNIHHVRSGTEIGLVWPWMACFGRCLRTDFQIVTCESDPSRHETLLGFIKRCQWKGSATTRIAEAVVREVWEARAAGRQLSWRDAMLGRGAPFVI